MTPIWVVVLLVVVLVMTVTVMWASFIATRLHRLNIRTDEAALSLDAALGRRAAIVSVLWPELVNEAEATERILFDSSNTTDRALAENAFAAQIRKVNDGSGTANGARALADAQTRVELAMRFYNDAVSDTRTLRLRPLVRVFHLGGHAAPPEYFEGAGIESGIPTL
ncbi:NUDIX hydrolase [Corynebacterium kroppenstedtii]|uniref:NUDIX hydrolase n=1 Tax=Corynebacterium sp. PCR 32 TaxID=3351342 RepID=UPI0030A844CB